MAKLTAKLLLKCDPITKTDGKGEYWLVGYKRRGSARSKKAGQEHWLNTPQKFTPAKSMQCVDCRFAPHNLSETAHAEHVRGSIEVPRWCAKHSLYQDERCTTKERKPLAKPVITETENGA